MAAVGAMETDEVLFWITARCPLAAVGAMETDEVLFWITARCPLASVGALETDEVLFWITARCPLAAIGAMETDEVNSKMSTGWPSISGLLSHSSFYVCSCFEGITSLQDNLCFG